MILRDCERSHTLLDRRHGRTLGRRQHSEHSHRHRGVRVLLARAGADARPFGKILRFNILSHY